ncbi:hypothetical protein HOY80DRAFT_1084820 [Tuber brumale]|nr:hypothetical protein HOY80DRAFT_1084820 [Tuber brumale]
MRTSVLVVLVSFGHTPLTEVGWFATSHPASAVGKDWTESLIAKAVTSHIVNSIHRALGGPHFQLSPICSKKRNKHELTIPLNPTNTPMSGIDAEMFFTIVMLGLKAATWPGWEGSAGGEGEEWIEGSCPRVPDIDFEILHYTPGAPAKKDKAWPGKPYDLVVATNRILPMGKSCFGCQTAGPLCHDSVLSTSEMGTPMGFGAVAYARSTILEDWIKDIGEAFQPPPPNQECRWLRQPSYRKGAWCCNCPVYEPRKMPCSPLPHRRHQPKDYYRFLQRYEHPGYLQRLMDESFKKKKHEDLEYSYVAFRRDIDHRADTKNKINPKIDDFGITPFDGKPDIPIQSPYTMHQLGNYSLTLPRIILPPIKRDSYIILDLCTPTGSIEH